MTLPVTGMTLPVTGMTLPVTGMTLAVPGMIPAFVNVILSEAKNLFLLYLRKKQNTTQKICQKFDFLLNFSQKTPGGCYNYKTIMLQSENKTGRGDA